MCWMCHQNMPDETVKEQLLSSLENPRYECWNSTSLNHLMLSLMGCNGFEVSELAHKLWTGYISWARETQNNGNMTSLQSMLDNVTIISEGLQKCKAEGLTDEQLKDKVREAMHQK